MTSEPGSTEQAPLKGFGLRVYIFVCLGILAAGPVLTLGAIQMERRAKVELQQSDREQLADAQMLARDIGQSIEGYTSSLDRVAAYVAGRGRVKSDADLQRQLGDELGRAGVLSAIYVTDGQLAVVDGEPAGTYALEPSLAKIVSRLLQAQVGAPIMNGSAEDFLHAAAPIIIEDKLAGYVVGVLDQQVLDALIRRVLISSPDVEVIILDRERRVLGRSHADPPLGRALSGAVYSAATTNGAVRSGVDYKGEKVRVSVVAVPHLRLGWNITVARPTHLVEAQARASKREVLWVSVISVLLGFVLAGILAWWLARPIGELARATARIGVHQAKGAMPVFPRRVPVEVRTLARSVGEMLERIDAQRSSLIQANDDLAENLEKLADNEQLLSLKEARMRAILDSSYDALVCVSSDGRVLDWNPAAERILGWNAADTTGKSFVELVLRPDDRAWFVQLTSMSGDDSAGQITRRELSVLTRAGAEAAVDVAVCTIAVGGQGLAAIFIHDLREQKRVEVELRQAQKLEAVGRLAAGVAHEINTPIQFINDSVHFVKEAASDIAKVLAEYTAAHGELGPESAAKIESLSDASDLSYLLENVPKALERSIEGLDRVATIVRSMKEFAHPDQKDMTTIDLNRAVQSTLTIACTEYKYVADLTTELGDLPPVRCLAGDLNQALLNIVVNAAHAIGDTVQGTDGKGRITVRTFQEHDCAVIAITDTGGGIPEAVRGRIFDPFFTTKEVGRGTGQGLAIAHSVVVDKHHGTLSFETELGKGTTFFLRIPLDGQKLAA